MLLPHIQRIPLHPDPPAVVPDGIGCIEKLVGHPLQKACRLKVLLNDLVHIGCLYFGIKGRLPLGGNDLHQRYLVAHTHTTHMFQLYMQSVAVDRILYRIPDFIAAAGHTTGTESNPYLPLYFAAIGQFELLFARFSFLTLKIGEYGTHLCSGDMAVGDLVDLDHRGKGAASQAVDLFDGIGARRGGILILIQSQLPLHGIVHLSGPFHMTGSAHTYLDHVVTGRGKPELGIETGYPHYLSRGDLRNLTHPAQCLFGQVVVPLLDGLQNGYDRALPASQFLHHRIYISYFNLHLILLTPNLLTLAQQASKRIKFALQILFPNTIQMLHAPEVDHSVCKYRECKTTFAQFGICNHGA